MPCSKHPKPKNFFDFVGRNLGQDIEYVLEPKFDGLSVELVYENGAYYLCPAGSIRMTAAAGPPRRPKPASGRESGAGLQF